MVLETVLIYATFYSDICASPVNSNNAIEKYSNYSAFIPMLRG